MVLMGHVVWNQSYCIEVAQGNSFIEQKLRFGPVLGMLAILKKKSEPFMSNF